jgi:hypothetical protein
MKMRRLSPITTVLLLGACGEAPPPRQAEAPATLPPGLYQLNAKVAALQSTDKTSPLTKLKVGDTLTTKACVGADGQPPAALFAAAGDQCTPKDPYVRGGRMSVAYRCTRAGAPGEVLVSVDGDYTASGMTGTATTTTYFTGSGDYLLKLEVTGKRAGQCAA